MTIAFTKTGKKQSVNYRQEKIVRISKLVIIFSIKAGIFILFLWIALHIFVNATKIK